MKKILVPCMLVLSLVNVFFVSIVALKMFAAAPLTLSCRPPVPQACRVAAFFTNDMNALTQAERRPDPAVITRTYSFTAPDPQSAIAASADSRQAPALCTIRKNSSGTLPQIPLVIIIYPENMEQ